MLWCSNKNMRIDWNRDRTLIWNSFKGKHLLISGHVTLCHVSLICFFSPPAPPPPPSRGGGPPPPPPTQHISTPLPPPPTRVCRGAPPPPPPSRAPISAPPPPPPTRPGSLGAPPPPPPTTRGDHQVPSLHQKIPPPPPQSSSHTSVVHQTTPPPPPLALQYPVGNDGSPAPAPPPTPLLNGLNGGEESPHWPSPSGSLALLEQIRGGTQLKKVEQSQRALTGGEGRDALLGQIRQGIQLKPVSQSGCFWDQFRTRTDWSVFEQMTFSLNGTEIPDEHV